MKRILALVALAAAPVALMATVEYSYEDDGKTYVATVTAADTLSPAALRFRLGATLRRLIHGSPAQAPYTCRMARLRERTSPGLARAATH